MSRVLIPAEAAWYHQLKTTAYYGELDLEREIKNHVISLFPDFFVFPFKREVTNSTVGDTKIPDLAMIRKDFAEWGIIEVELAEHRLDEVIAQTDCFATGDYNAPEIAKYIRDQLLTFCDKQTTLNRIKNLVSNETPKVLVVADSYREKWQQRLKKAGVDFCIFETFKNTRGHYIYRAFGDYPTVPCREAHCRRHAQLPNVLEIIGNFQFKNARKKRVDVMFDSMVTRWSVFVEKGRRYLRFLGTVNPLSANVTYRLYADKSDKYYFSIN